MFTKEKQAEIAKIIKSKIKDNKCPMCNNNNFEVGEGYFVHQSQKDLNNIVVGGQDVEYLPTIPIICTNCGFVSDHSLKVLGII